MDILLSKITQQAMNYAIRSGITITSGYAIRQCARLLQTVDKDDRDKLAALQQRLQSKIRIISPAIDMIELISARGNTSLGSAVTLTKELRWEIQALGLQLARAANSQEEQASGGPKRISKAQTDITIKFIIQDIQKLLDRIEDAVPLINLAITTSGARLSSTLPSTVSPSRLLQASTFLTAGDLQFSMDPNEMVQIGPAFTLSLYMLFSGHSIREQTADGNLRDATWQEVMHKARVKLCRVPLRPTLNQQRLDEKDENSYPDFVEGAGRSDEFSYVLTIIEDLDDDRVHTVEDGEEAPGPFEDVEKAGVRESLPIHEISKIFYADTGKILNIGNDSETNSPVLLLKRDPNAVPPRRMADREFEEFDPSEDETSPTEDKGARSNSHRSDDDVQSDVDSQLFSEQLSGSTVVNEPPKLPRHSLPAGLDPEWLAFEVYVEEQDSESETEDIESPAPNPSRSNGPRQASKSPNLSSKLSSLEISSANPSTPVKVPSPAPSSIHSTTRNGPISSPMMWSLATPAGPVRSSLSLLETLIRLTSLQQFQQVSHLSITDELLNFFLAESSSTGAGPDSDTRRRTRADARRKVGFDPYDESPVKFRGEEYLSRTTNRSSQSEGKDPDNSLLAEWEDRETYASSSPVGDKSGNTGIEYSSDSPWGPSSPLESKKGRSRPSLGRKDPGFAARSSPLRRIVSQTDSTLGTSPST